MKELTGPKHFKIGTYFKWNDIYFKVVGKPTLYGPHNFDIPTLRSDAPDNAEGPFSFAMPVTSSPVEIPEVLGRLKLGK